MSRHALDYRAIFCMGTMTERGERPKNFGQHPPRGNGKEITTPRDVLIEQWRNAPEGVYRYPAGQAIDSQGNPYEYSEGTRLWIGDQREVMDSCQRPWVIETVKKGFEPLDPEQRIEVLERGFGLGLTAGEIRDRLRRLKEGGSHTVIELNKQVANFVRTSWIKKQEAIDRARATSEIGGKYAGPNVVFELIEGDAVEETEKLVAIGREFDLIVSDTYPLSDDERSINDLIDLETLIKLLKPNGVFAFFGYHTGYQGGMNEKQRNLVERHFEEVSRTTVKGINPPPDYKYFNPENGPTVRELPVIICTKPRLLAAA